MRAERRGLGRHRTASQKRTDESGEQITTAAGCQTGVSTGYDMLRAAQIRDNRGNAFQENRAFEFGGGARRGRPAIVRGFVGQCVTGQRAELSEMWGAHEPTTARRHVATKKM